MATYSLSALQRSRRKFMRIYWVAGLRKWRPTGSFRPEPDIQQGFTLRFGGAYKAGGRQPASVAMRCGLVRQR